MKSKNTYLPLYLCAALAVGIVIGGSLGMPREDKIFAKNNSRTKLNKLIDFIDSEYVDDVDTDSIVHVTTTIVT